MLTEQVTETGDNHKDNMTVIKEIRIVTGWNRDFKMIEMIGILATTISTQIQTSMTDCRLTDTLPRGQTRNIRSTTLLPNAPQLDRQDLQTNQV
jgi:hypothetical protein